MNTWTVAWCPTCQTSQPFDLLGRCTQCVTDALHRVLVEHHPDLTDHAEGNPDA